MRNKIMTFLYIVMTISVLGWGIALLMEGKPKQESAIKLSKEMMSALPKDSPAIIHFFSSWCVYCRTEYPFMIDLKSASDLPIIGVAYKDTQEQLVPWLDHMGNPFSQIIYDEDAKLSYQMGVTAIPQTFVMDAQGRVIYSQNESMSASSYMKLKRFLQDLNEKN